MQEMNLNIPDIPAEKLTLVHKILLISMRSPKYMRIPRIGKM